MELTQRELAQVLGCSPASIVAWERDEGLPSLGDRGKERLYDAAAVVQWYVGRELRRRGAEDPDRQRLVRAQADRAEHELAVRRAEFCRADDVARGCREIARDVADSVLQVPARIAPVVAPIDQVAAERLMTEELRRVLAGLAARLKGVVGG